MWANRLEPFVTPKITPGLAAILAGTQKDLYLGNLDARCDWGYAPDYVEAMWMMLQKDQPDDFVIGSGQIHTVRNLLDQAFGYVNLDWHEYVKVDPTLLRKEESVLRADISKAKLMLGWKPRVFFKDLVHIMVDADLELIGLDSPGEGAKIIKKHHGDWHRWGSQGLSMGTHATLE